MNEYAKDFANRLDGMSAEEIVDYMRARDLYFKADGHGTVYDIEMWRNYAEGRMMTTSRGCFFHEGGEMKSKWYFSEELGNGIMQLATDNFKEF